jgi:hypothetical protein
LHAIRAFSLKYLLLFLEEYEQSQKKKGHTFNFALHALHCQALGSPLELMTPKHPQLLQVLKFPFLGANF